MKAETSHTPGPWSLRETYPDKKIIVEAQQRDFPRCICVVGTVVQEQVIEDARLIAAAPELLEALKRLLELAEEGEASDMYGQDQARKAIAKAEGIDS